jgi:hypothetical protein
MVLKLWTLRDSTPEIPGKNFFLMWCWRRVEKISWTDRVRNGEVLQGTMQDRNTLHTCTRIMKKRRLTGLVTSCVGTTF